MSSLSRIGQVLKVRTNIYTITKEIQSTVWFAENHLQELAVIKSVQGHPRAQNERDVLRRFQHRTPCLRPLIDEIEKPSAPVTIALKHLQADLLHASVARTLDRREFKYVSRCVLEALKTLHEDGFVYADVKPEILFEQPWNTATGIWAFGAMLIALIYGGNFNLFNPKPQINPDDEQYVLGVILEQFKYFGPFPAKIAELYDLETNESIILIMENILKEKTTTFRRTS